MKQKSTSMIAVLLAVFLGLLTGMNGQLLGQGGTVVSKFGEAQVAGRDVIVHVTVVVPPGANANQVALDALRNQGARPFQGDEFSTSGLVWDEFLDNDPGNDTVIQNYNPANDPTGANVLGVLMSAQSTWTDVLSSKFAFSVGDVAIDRCPSLVKECKGPQTFDGFNDVGWLVIRGCCTLAVTWFSTSIDEADMAINTNFSWSTDGINDYDLQSVILHENGHVAGLGHSPETTAVMFATYHGPDQDLNQDDIDGITFLYPDVTGMISGMVKGEDGVAISEATVSVDGTLAATTDVDGSYDIILATGIYDLTASAAGFFSQSIEEVSVEETPTTFADFSLLAADNTETENTGSLEISDVFSKKSGKGGNFQITWDTNIPATSEVTFDCCGTFSNSERVTGHSMSFRGQKGATYTYSVSSTDADGNTATSYDHTHNN